jgi:hypothetical protein
MPHAREAAAQATPGQPYGRALDWLRNPAALFVILSLLFGAATLAVTPPLRGPDERAHFVRAYGIATGEILPSQHDAQGRKGIFVPSFLYDELNFYEAARHQVGASGFSYRNVMPTRWDLRAEASPRDRTPVFFLYDGSEGYSPVPYLPYALMAMIARAADLDFLTAIYLMRTAGLALWTAVIAYAITTVPVLKWAFLMIAMLPSALYGRAVISADGAVLASTLVAIALSAKCAFGGGGTWARSFWTAACALTKPPQIAFVLLETAVGPFRSLPRRWRGVLIVAGPAIILAPLWVIVSSADSASWRYAMEGSIPREQFDPIWKVQFLIQNPLHFPRVMLATLADLNEWSWKQLIGVLGWLDTPLVAWVYPATSAMLAASFFEPLRADREVRFRVIVASVMTALAYIVLTLLILFIAITTTAQKTIEGVQGRYFVVVLPLIALVTAATLTRGLPRFAAGAAIAGALVSGCAVLEAVLRVDWP